ncbi:MAG TPA: right-handed parallel beta-helix repeat-containing protein, partial [Blastocatellia bacterium]|nr:right-handed parallel beta-helix repeat-containing protein [Blastocatellia bacterium]
MKQFVFAIASIMACAMAAVEASAATFHVSTSGADSNPGTVAEPWASLQHAVDTIQPGDTILIESGTYPGCRIGNSGLATAVCTLKASSGAQVLVNAPGPGNKHASNIEIENFDATVQYWVIDGLESAGSPKYGIDIRGTDHITVRNCFVHGSAATGIFMAFCDHPLIESNESSLNAEHGIYDSNSGDFPVIRGNKIHDNRNAGIHINGDQNFTPGDGIISFALVEQNIIYENGIGGASGINCDGVSDSIIRNNLLYNNHASGISLYATDGAEGSSRDKVYNNTIVMASGARWCVNIPASDNGQPNP